MPIGVPDDLAARMAEGETVLFVGAGMSGPRLPGGANCWSACWRGPCRRQISLAGASTAPAGRRQGVQEILTDDAARWNGRRLQKLNRQAN